MGKKDYRRNGKTKSYSDRLLSRTVRKTHGKILTQGSKRNQQKKAVKQPGITPTN
jgi:hypothetical protein